MKTGIAILIALAATSTPLVAQETVRFKDAKKNPDLEGEIVTLSCKLIEILTFVNGTRIKQSAEARLAAEIIPSTARKTPDFAKGEDAMANGDFPSAILRFERVVSDPRAGELLRQLSAIDGVRCQASAGNLRGVIAAAQSLRDKQPNGYWVRESYQHEVKAYLALKNQAGAKAAIAAFAALGNALAMQEWVSSAELLDGELAEFQNNWRGALATYRKYARDPEAAEGAAFGELRCLTALSDWPGIKARADGILKDAQDGKNVHSRLLIAAYTGKGDADRSGGKTLESLLAYLQGAMVLNRGESSPEHETSVARSALACITLAATEKEPARKALYRSRSKEMIQELNHSYPGSRYQPEVEKAFLDLR